MERLHEAGLQGAVSPCVDQDGVSTPQLHPEIAIEIELRIDPLPEDDEELGAAQMPELLRGKGERVGELADDPFVLTPAGGLHHVDVVRDLSPRLAVAVVAS